MEETHHGPPPETPAALPVPRPTATTRGRGFDVAFGLFLPVLCLLCDPGILRGRGMLSTEVPHLRGQVVAVYASILASLVVLGLWLGSGRGALLLAGPLFAGSLVALAVGVALLPLSLPAAIILIGLLGLVPFGTAFAFLRNAVRAFRAACLCRSAAVVALVTLLLGGSFLALPLAAQAALNERVQAVIDAALGGDPEREARAVARLKPFGWLAHAEVFLAASRAATDPGAQQRLARAWEAATGEILWDPSD